LTGRDRTRDDEQRTKWRKQDTIATIGLLSGLTGKMLLALEMGAESVTASASTLGLPIGH